MAFTVASNTIKNEQHVLCDLRNKKKAKQTNKKKDNKNNF